MTPENQYTENILVQINTLNKLLLLGPYYRPPYRTLDFWESFETSLETAADQSLDLIIMDEFNQDIKDISICNSNKFNRIMQKFNIENLIRAPTRVTETSQTCIDLILTNHTSVINKTLKFFPHSAVTTVLLQLK